jgi:hypothetical protein
MATEIEQAIQAVPLLDHHAHGIRLAPLSGSAFGDLINESSSYKVGGLKALDKPIGLNIRSLCAPVLGLEQGASFEDYFSQREALGEDASRKLIEACGLSNVMIDTYDRGNASLTDPVAFSRLGPKAHEVLRLESLFENVASAHGQSEGLVQTFKDHLETLIPKAVGLKTIIGYRAGFALDHRPPPSQDLRKACDAWMTAKDAGQRFRVSDSLICRAILWAGSELARDHEIPIQFHVAIGDEGVNMPANDPSHLRLYLKEMQDWGVSITLLHCYPYVRTAQWLADIFDNVYYDIGFMLPFGSPEIERLFREAFEIGPFHKQLYSSDAFDVAEIYTISALRFRRYLTRMLSDWVKEDYCTFRDAISIAERVCFRNAERIYRLDGGTDA